MAPVTTCERFLRTLLLPISLFLLLLASVASADIDALRERARANEARAMTLIGFAYFHGDGVEADYAEALRWFEQGSAAGDPLATAFLGVRIWDEGRADEAFPLIRSAAVHGDALALTNLGVMYRYGEGTEASETLAIAAFEAAAAQGATEAMFQLSELLCCDTPADEARSRALLRRAAALNHAGAQLAHAEHLLEQGDEDSRREAGFFLRGNAVAVNNLAWRLATAGDAADRDGPRAVRLMEALLDDPTARRATHVDTLAGAYAEVQRFDEAAATQREAIAALPEDTDEQIRAGFEERLSMYLRGEAFREEPGE